MLPQQPAENTIDKPTKVFWATIYYKTEPNC